MTSLAHSEQALLMLFCLVPRPERGSGMRLDAIHSSHCFLRYVSIENAVQLVGQLVPGTLLAKLDL